MILVWGVDVVDGLLHRCAATNVATGKKQGHRRHQITLAKLACDSDWAGQVYNEQVFSLQAASLT